MSSQSKLETLQQDSKYSGSKDNVDIAQMEKLSKISAKHREILREHLEEFCLMRHYVNPVITHSQLSNVARRSSNFTRIFPAPGTSQYDIFFQGESLQLSQ
jgi:hypothetical protein